MSAAPSRVYPWGLVSTVTKQINRHIAPEAAEEVHGWVRRGQDVMNGFDGYLGSGLVRLERGAHVWHMVYRFADEQTCRVWEDSAERAAWAAEMAGHVVSEEVTARTGIEGWFDPVEMAMPVTPPRWKQMAVIFLGFFPMSLLAQWLLGMVLPPALPLFLRVLVTTCCVMPVMVYLVLPNLTRLLEPWLMRSRED